MMKRCLESWAAMVSAFVSKLPVLLPRRLSKADSDLRREDKLWDIGRPIDTHQGGPNMPKRQPCDCGRWVKRVYKTSTGAKYYCNTCKNAIYVKAH
jgi:hypothetical protein